MQADSITLGIGYRPGYREIREIAEPHECPNR